MGVTYRSYNENTGEFEDRTVETVPSFLNTEYTQATKESEFSEYGLWVLMPYPDKPRWEWRQWGDRTELSCEVILSSRLCCLLDGTDPEYDPIPF